jgi:hypothetical protein
MMRRADREFGKAFAGEGRGKKKVRELFQRVADVLKGRSPRSRLRLSEPDGVASIGRSDEFAAYKEHGRTMYRTVPLLNWFTLMIVRQVDVDALEAKRINDAGGREHLGITVPDPI